MLNDAEILEMKIFKKLKNNAAIQYYTCRYSIFIVTAAMVVFILDLGDNFHIPYHHRASGETNFEHDSVIFFNIVAFTNKLGLIDC